MKFFIKFFGCQYNEWDAVRLSSILKSLGLGETNKDDADFIFLLNCSVRKSAVDRTFGLVKNFLAQNKKVVITGCILKDDQRKFEKKGCLIWDGVDFEKLSKLLKINYDSRSTLYSLPSTNLVPIMKGCNNFCSYCAVPYTRGREVSRLMKEILDDIEKIIETGQKEIILLGQNVNSYKDPASVVISNDSEKSHEISRLDKSMARNDKVKNNFATLLQKINNLPGEFIVKFTSNHPKDMSDDIIEAIATLPKVAKEIHLPLQSGSNIVLRSMNRPYTIEQYLKLVSDLKFKIKNLKLSTDVIVGFPTETEADFQKTVAIFKKIKFAQAYINKYSPRSGTAAFGLGDPIPWVEKDRRWRILNELIKR